MSATLLLLLAASAWADEEPRATEFVAWSTSAVSVGPQALGDPEVRAVEELGLDARLGPMWEVRALSALRWRGTADTFDKVDLYTAQVAHTRPGYRVELGRLVRADPRGLEHLDGATLDTGTDRSVSGAVWAGRMWHPETWELLDAWVGGARLRWRPTASAGHLAPTRVEAGWEGRVGDEPAAQRIDAYITTRGPYGAYAEAGAELQPDAEGGARVQAAAATVVGPSLIGLEARWEGLAPVGATGATRVAWDWLAPDGYGIAAATARVQLSPVFAHASGGPTWVPGEPDVVGAQARVGVGWALGEGQASVFGQAAEIGHRALGGVGIQTRTVALGGRLDTTLAGYEFQPIDGDARPVWASELAWGRTLTKPGATRRLDLQLFAGAGRTRVLQIWGRGGVAVTGTLDTRQGLTP